MNIRASSRLLFATCTIILTLVAHATEASWEGSLEYVGSTATFTTQATRCLPSTIYTLSRAFHLRTGYEDAPVEFAGDMIDVTAPGRKGLRILIPRGGPLSLRFEVDAVTHKPLSFASTLNEALTAYRSFGYPGSYRLTVKDAWFYIVPSSARSRAGTDTQVTPLFDAELRPEELRHLTLDDALEKALSVVGARTGNKIVLGRRLPNQWGTVYFSPNSAASATARDVIEQIMDASGSPISWLLLYDPTFHYYVFTPYLV
jgi:hypothetical protein